MSQTQRIPLFPLHRVLFPKMIMPLHIFEERYKEMINFCVENDKEFGIIPANNLQEGAVGTSSRVYQVVKTYDDGRLDILGLGTSRFHLHSVISEKSFVEGEVSLFDDIPSSPVPARHEMENLVALYRTYIARLGLRNTFKKDLSEILDRMDDESEISYIIAQTLGMELETLNELLKKRRPLERFSMLSNELNRLESLHSIARDLFENNDFDPIVN